MCRQLIRRSVVQFTVPHADVSSNNILNPEFFLIGDFILPCCFVSKHSPGTGGSEHSAIIPPSEVVIKLGWGGNGACA